VLTDHAIDLTATTYALLPCLASSRAIALILGCVFGQTKNNEWGQHFSTGQHNFTDDGLAQLNYSVLHREHNNQWGGYEWVLESSFSSSSFRCANLLQRIIPLTSHRHHHPHHHHQIVWDPQTPLLGNQRDRVPPEEIQKCFDRVRRAWLWA
jgi:hypothetical protein